MSHFASSTIQDHLPMAGWPAPRESQSLQQINLQMFHQLQQSKDLPQRCDNVSPLSSLPSPQLYNAHGCDQGIYFPSWEGRAHAHVTSGVRVHRKTTKGIKENRTRLTPRPQGHTVHPTGAMQKPSWPLGAGPSEAGILLALPCGLTS